jgi:hypothetical protein
MAFSSVDPEIQSAQEDSERQKLDNEEFDPNQAAEELEEGQEQDRLNKRQQLAQRAKSMAGDVAKKVVKQAVRKAGQRVGASVLVATAPYWGAALAIILMIGWVIIMMLVSVAVICSSNYTDSFEVAGFKLAIASLPGDICKDLALAGGRSGGAGGGATFDPTTSKLDIVLTSAYRPGSYVDNNRNNPSAHGRGEAFDVALRNPQVGFYSQDPRIDKIIALARGMGFTHPNGDVVDEYRNPSPGTTGPHIHIEFNKGYCSTAAATDPPNDMVSLVGLVPMSDVDNPEVRECMHSFVINLFKQAGVIP